MRASEHMLINVVSFQASTNQKMLNDFQFKHESLSVNDSNMRNKTGPKKRHVHNIQRIDTETTNNSIPFHQHSKD